MRCVRPNSSSPLCVSGYPGETNRQQSEAGEAGESEVRLTKGGDKEATEVKRVEAGQR